MLPSKIKSLSVDVVVADLLKRIEYWRSTRNKRGRMPREFWVESSKLARLHGVWAISKVLRLNYEVLKAWTEEVAEGQSAPSETADRCEPRVSAPRRTAKLVARTSTATEKPTFIRLDPLPAMSVACSSVEVHVPGGAKMVIQLSSSATLDAVALVEAFLSRRR